MPEMIPLGWFHTAMGIIALVSGGFTLARFKEISLQTRSGQIYLVTTLITAGTALAIFQRGEFGPGHALAVMITDGLLRLPVGDPVLTSIEDPILKMCYLGLLVIFLVGVGLQLCWIHRQPA
jgi:uncharacterized membrane protein